MIGYIILYSQTEYGLAIPELYLGHIENEEHTTFKM